MAYYIQMFLINKAIINLFQFKKYCAIFWNNSLVRNNVSLFGFVNKKHFEIMNLQNRKNKQSVHGTQVNGPYPNKSHSKHTKNRHNGIPEK